jgi:hypothetical protein
MRNVAAVALLALFAWGCSPSDAEAGLEEDGSAEVASFESVGSGNDLENAAEWIGTTQSGIKVTVRPDRVPVHVGRTNFQISFEQDLPDETSVSIDVISPEMPMMGLMRYPAEPSGTRTYIASAEIRMDGAWEIYVNLGDGTDAAPFAFDVHQ